MIDWEYLAGLRFSVVWEYREALFEGFLITLALTFASTVMGFFGGVILAIGSQSALRPLRWLVAAYVEVWRNTPLLVQVFWIHFALPTITGISTTAFQSGLITLTLNVTAYFTEIARAGIESINRGQWEASRSLGLPTWTTWTSVILPQAIRIIVPPMASMVIGIFKGTAVLSILSVNDLMRVANLVSNVTFRPVEVITTVAVVYYLIGTTLSWASGRIERAFTRGRN